MTDTRAPRALIVGGGTSPGSARLLELSRAYDFVIAADAGLVHLSEAGIVPAYVTGDFDSVPTELLDPIPAEHRIHDPGQDCSDLEKAIRLGTGMSVSEMGLACVTGTRIDHTVNAVNLMLRYQDRVAMTLFDTHGDAAIVNPPGIEILGAAGEKLSLVPAPGASGLQSEGLLFPLTGVTIGFGERDGISNEMTSDTALISFDSGCLLLYRQRPLPLSW